MSILRETKSLNFVKHLFLRDACLQEKRRYRIGLVLLNEQRVPNLVLNYCFSGESTGREPLVEREDVTGGVLAVLLQRCRPNSKAGRQMEIELFGLRHRKFKPAN